MDIILQCLAALLASTFFGALLRQPKDTLIYTSLIGLNGYLLYLLLNKTAFAFFAAALVVGLPTHADGTPHEMTRLARKFAQRLHGRFGLPVWLVDERHSSQVAEVQLNDAGLRGRRQKPALDQVAAQVILQSFLDMPQAAGIEPL